MSDIPILSKMIDTCLNCKYVIIKDELIEDCDKPIDYICPNAQMIWDKQNGVRKSE